MNFKLKIWRQKDRTSTGKLVDYEVREISPHTSFLEMLDILNESLVGQSEDPIASKGFAVPAHLL
jgi:succinate dehydrogenase iron-sulfur subunit